jgi:hypothetical protein
MGAEAYGQGGCLNQILYPSNIIVPNSNGTVTTISTCSFETEYSAITGLVNGGTYQFVLASGGYITVREGTFDGPVVAEGTGTVDVLSNGSDLFAHWTINAACATQTGCVVTTVQFLLDCTPPEATYTITEDCDQGTFSVTVDVASTGDATSVNIVYDLMGTVETIPGVGPGTYELGPFITGDFVDVSVQHESDFLCNVNFGILQSPLNCPQSISCGVGPSVYNYCYTNNENKQWTFQATSVGTLVLSFISGSIEGSFSDQLVIYDGADATGTVLFQHTLGALLDLSGVTVSGTSGFLHMVLTSDGFGSCSTGQTSEWNWSVTCLNCLIPSVTASSVDDCPNNQFSIPVNVGSTGDGSTVSLLYSVNGGPALSIDGVTTGETILGPFTVNDLVTIVVQHEFDPSCNVNLGTFTDEGNCPNLITCGAPPLGETYCYEPNEVRTWGYQAIGTGTLRLRFNRGTIESNTWDQLAIYDGADASGALLFEHTNFTTYNLGPVGSAINNAFPNYYAIEVYSTTGNLFMELSSDGSGQCGGDFPSTNFDAWDWEVVCLDCNIPLVSATVVDDCANNQFSIPVDVSSTGDGSSVNIVYTVNAGAAEVLAGVGAGVTTLGPFTVNDVVNIVVEHESNSLCNISLGNFTDTGTCPTLVECGTEYNETFCHGENENAIYYYQGTGTFPLALIFNGGSLETCCDRLFVYDGADITAPELTPAGGITGNLAGQFFASTNPEHRLTVRVTTDGSVSCQSGSNIQLDWTLSCLDCNPPSATFNIAQDCDNFQYFIDVNVTTLGTDPEVEITNTSGLASTFITAPGTYQIGPFVSGTQTQLTLVNDANSLCNLSSAVLVNPICPLLLCGSTPLVETYCYTNNEDRAWAYATPTAGTIRLIFNRGTIESSNWDRVTVYDGSDETGTVLFTHSNFQQYNLGPTGSAVLSTASPYYGVDVTTTTGNLYMTLTSDGSGSCGGGSAYDPWEWTVQCIGCQAPGVSYNLVPDCFNRSYTTEVIVTQAPSQEGLVIEETISGATQTVTAVGVYTFGPYDQNDNVVFGLTDQASPECTFFTDSITYSSDSCVIRSCGVDSYTHCYGNNSDRWYTFQSELNVPTTLSFLSGQLLTGDRIVVYNGFDESATIIYQGINGGNLAGFAVNSQNVNNALTLRIQSNDAGSCATGEATIPMTWAVGCGAVGLDELAQDGFAVYPNPTEGTLYIELGAERTGNVRVRVLDMSGRVVLEQPLNVKAGVNTLDMGRLQTGQYMVELTTDNWVKTQRVQVSR